MKFAQVALLVGILLRANMGLSAECNVLTPTYLQEGVASFSGQMHVVADFNQDGNDDFVALNAVLSKADSAGYDLKDSLNYYASDLAQFSLAAGDLNGDGKKDLVRSYYSGHGGRNIEILLNDGQGNFTHPQDESRGLYYNGTPGIIYNHGLTLADVNNDGLLDIVSTARTKVSVLLGKGNGTFSEPVLSAAAAATTEHVLVADLDKDGLPDLVTAVADLKRDGQARSHGRTDFLVYKGLGDGRFSLKQKFTVDAHVTSADMGKINQAGDVGLILTGQRGKLSGRGGIYVYKHNRAQGEFEEIYNDNNELLNRRVLHATVGDFNEDGVLDLVFLRSQTVSLRLNDGQGKLDKSYETTNPSYEVFSDQDVLVGHFKNLSSQITVYGKQKLQFFSVNKTCLKK